ncbi:hypothetical protein V5O48_013785 [Marasmius crinis-equi]|uniref:Uncharacterized protein n=1 Tax=Marasmius crinis-equi TaxID=585013 RepID=A0ABR3EZ43_9AGAR
MQGSDCFKGATQTRISGTPIFSSTEGNSTQHITPTHTHNYHNSTVNFYYSSPPAFNSITAQSRPPVDDDVNGSEPDQRQATTTPSSQGSRGEGRVERLDRELEQVSNPPADGNDSRMSVQKKTLLERIRALLCGGTGIGEVVDV